MCSILMSRTAKSQLDELESSGKRGDREMIEKRLERLAQDASPDNPGALDTPDCLIKRMPPGLRELRKRRIGRHRAYFKGSHHICFYKVGFIKLNKKKGTDDEDDPNFQNKVMKVFDTDSFVSFTGGGGIEGPSFSAETEVDC